jgi:hypothetical protein
MERSLQKTNVLYNKYRIDLYNLHKSKQNAFVIQNKTKEGWFQIFIH